VADEGLVLFPPAMNLLSFEKKKKKIKPSQGITWGHISPLLSWQCAQQGQNLLSQECYASTRNLEHFSLLFVHFNIFLELNECAFHCSFSVFSHAIL
jgi:hypothetical protein